MSQSSKVIRIDDHETFKGETINDLMKTVNRLDGRKDVVDYQAYCESCGVPTDQVGK